jgi:hypothetical protein
MWCMPDPNGQTAKGSVEACEALCQPNYNQEWLGPDSSTGGTILYRPSWNGKEYTKCANLRKGDTTNGNAIELWCVLFRFCS